MGKQGAKQRTAAATASPQRQQQQSAATTTPDDDTARVARVRRLVLQTSLVSAAAFVASWYGLISDKLALAVMAAGCLTLRFFAFS